MRQRGDMPDLAFGLFRQRGLALAAFFTTTRTLETGTAPTWAPASCRVRLPEPFWCSGIGYLAKGLLSPGHNPLPAYAWRPLVCNLRRRSPSLRFCFQHLGLDRRRHSSHCCRLDGRASGLWLPRPAAFRGPALAAFSALLFVKGLGLPLRLWPW